MTGAGVYFHVPFCAHRCSYCSFVTAAGREGEDAYFQALETETRARRAEIVGPVETVYFGGGTPSWVDPDRLFRLLELVAPSHPPTLVEVTAEGNPDDLSSEKLEGLSAAGVNRLSIGVQSLVDGELALLERRHDAAGAAAALRRGVSAFPSVSADLMIGIPGQTRETLRRTVLGILETAVCHVSAYILEVEKAPRLLALRASSPALFPDDDEVAERWEDVDDLLTGAGLSRYELSNWARRGKESKHNLKYWTGAPVLGLGLGAHSFDGTTRSANTASMSDYLHRVGERGTGVVSTSRLSPDEALREEVLLALRVAEGVSAPLYEKAVATASPADRARLLDCGEAGLLERAGGRVRLTRRGVLLSNEVFALLV